MAFNMKPANTMTQHPFNGHLNINEVQSSLFNALIKIVSRYPKLANNYNFVNMFREEGGKFGDTIEYVFQDVLRSREWQGDNEAMNLLDIERPADPDTQTITINKFRVIKSTTDNFLSARGWGNESAFSTFIGIVKSLVGKTKEVYENTMMQVFIGTAEGTAKISNHEVPVAEVTNGTTGDEKNRLTAQAVGEHVAKLIVQLKDYSRDFNPLGNLQAYNDDDLVVVWNTDWLAKLTKYGMSTIFHKDGLIDKFADYTLPAYKFGTIVSEGGTAPSGNTTIRAMYEKDYNTKVVNGATVIMKQSEAGYDPKKHVFAGEALPAGVQYEAYEAYTVDEDVICKIMTKDSIKYAAGFSTSTEFFNAQSLTTSNMLIWSYADPALILDQPFITVHAD